LATFVDYDLTLVVNEYVKTNIGVHVIYDDDIKAKEEVNGNKYGRKKTQLKQVLEWNCLTFKSRFVSYKTDFK
jgi:hypothetical protein